MMQSYPTSYNQHFRVFLVAATTATIAMGTVVITPSATSQRLNAQVTSSTAPQSVDATAASPTKADETTTAAQPQATAAESKEMQAPAGKDPAASDSGDSESDSESDDRATNNDDSLLGNFFSTPPVGYLIQGGLFMWPILLMGIIGAGVIIERYRSLNMLSGDSRQLRTDVQTLLETNKVKEAFELCNGQQGPVPAILATGLRKYLVLQTLDYEPAKIEEQVVKSMDDYSVHIVAALERHLPILATISSAAPMLGFLGTVQGMIVAFDDIVAKMGETNIVEAAAVGIKVSLMTTCFGLIVGIPAFVAFNYFTGLINRFVLDVEESATEMIEAVTLQTAINTADSKPEEETAQ